MSKYIAVAGKGGTGKTTFCSLLIKYLIKKDKTPILAVDADANANLNEVLGLPLTNETVSELIAKTKDYDGIPQGMDKETYIQYKLNASLSEGKDIDLLVMGGPDGPGCYCFPNNILRKYLDNLSSGYKYIIMDNEAGLEHLSRRTTRDVDILFVISDSSARGVRSAGRVNSLVKGLQTEIKKKCLVITKASSQDIEILNEEIKKTELDLVGVIPHDEILFEYDAKGIALTELPENSKAVQAVFELLDSLKI
jgi:CO dehydrogenase maturation factor